MLLPSKASLSGQKLVIEQLGIDRKRQSFGAVSLIRLKQFSTAIPRVGPFQTLSPRYSSKPLRYLDALSIDPVGRDSSRTHLDLGVQVCGPIEVGAISVNIALHVSLDPVLE